MTYLLDTHTLIWAITKPDHLSQKVRSLIENPDESIAVSAITFWEISLKYRLGKLQLENIEPSDFPDICKLMDIEMLPLEVNIGASYHELKATHHRDPFDRMLIWLAKHRNMTLLSKDETLKLYGSEGVRVVW